MIKHVSNKIQNAIQIELFKAKESIKIAVAWFTNELLLQPLILKLQSGVSVELILNDDEINRGGDSSLDFTEFLQAGGVLRWNDSKQLMHEKFCIIDNRIVISGSYNWTNKAEYNSEVENFFYDEKETTEFYNEIFENLSSRYEADTCIKDNSNSNIKEERGHIDKNGHYVDEYGAIYSGDKKIIIKGANIPNYVIDPHTIKIGKEAFLNYSNLISVSIPEGVTTISELAFGCCSNLVKIYLPKTLNVIENEAFMGCDKITSLEIPESVYSIGAGAFSSCYHLAYIKIPNVITKISENLFSGCKRLKNISLPKRIVEIDEQAFSGCGLEFIDIPNSVMYIQDGAFFNCDSLKSLFIPEGVVSIKGNIISHCHALESIKISKNNEFYDSRNNCNAIIESSTHKLIAGCKNTIIPDDISEISEGAFLWCNLKSLIIPASVTSIKKGAFDGCSLLEEITICSSNIDLPMSIFNFSVNLRQINVPIGSKDTFKKKHLSFRDIVINEINI